MMDALSPAAFQMAQRGDPRALSLVVKAHMPLVRALCVRVGAYDEDAFQQGCMELVRAVRGYDTSRGTAFSTYAVPYILGGARRAQASRALLHGGWRMRRDLNRVRAAHEALLREGHEPDVRALARRVGMEPYTLMLLLEQRMPPQSLDAEEGVRWCERLPDPHSTMWMERFFLRDMVSRLPAEDQCLVYLRYVRGEPQTLAASRLALSQPQLSRREARLRLSLRAAWTFEPPFIGAT